jgi:hypothetical protein
MVFVKFRCHDRKARGNYTCEEIVLISLWEEEEYL